MALRITRELRGADRRRHSRKIHGDHLPGRTLLQTGRHAAVQCQCGRCGFCKLSKDISHRYRPLRTVRIRKPRGLSSRCGGYLGHDKHHCCAWSSKQSQVVWLQCGVQIVAQPAPLRISIQICRDSTQLRTNNSLFDSSNNPTDDCADFSTNFETIRLVARGSFHPAHCITVIGVSFAQADLSSFVSTI